MRGNSRYNASQIGRQLTAGRIEATWKQLHREMDAEAARAKAEYERRHHFVCEPTHPDTKSVRFEFDRILDGCREAEHFVFDISQDVVGALSDTLMEMASDFEFVFEQVMETSIFMFFELLTVDTGCQTSSYGGGNAKDVSNKKRRDDDNDELYRARRIARTVARSCPRKVVRRGFRR